MSAWDAKGRKSRLGAIRRRDGHRCWLCGERVNHTDATIDHAIPKGRGGTNHLHNLRLAHESCNQERGCIAKTAPRAAQVRLGALAITTESAT